VKGLPGSRLRLARWLFCANVHWFHALKYTQFVGCQNGPCSIMNQT